MDCAKGYISTLILVFAKTFNQIFKDKRSLINAENIRKILVLFKSEVVKEI